MQDTLVSEIKMLIYQFDFPTFKIYIMGIFV